MRAIRNAFVAALLICLLAWPAAAQEDQPTPGALGTDEELGQAIREQFGRMLRAELALSDEEMAVILPRLEQIELAKREAMRERRRTLFQLQRGLQGGASDAELAGLLKSLDGIEDEQRSAERTAMAEIDGQLTVRQQVKLRFFAQRFRRELTRRLQGGMPPGR